MKYLNLLPYPLKAIFLGFLLVLSISTPTFATPGNDEDPPSNHNYGIKTDGVITIDDWVSYRKNDPSFIVREDCDKKCCVDNLGSNKKTNTNQKKSDFESNRTSDTAPRLFLYPKE